jgi:hypothetical protein
MRTLLAVLGLLIAASAYDRAAAVEYPWCADLGNDIGATNCGFTTLEQCQRTVRGTGGSCVRNNFYRGESANPPARSKKPKRSDR